MTRTASVHQQAEACLAQRRAADAVLLLRGHLQDMPTDAVAWNLLGMAQSAERDHAGAVDSLQRAATLLPRQAAVFNNLGNALQAAGRAREAVAAFERAVQLAPDLQVAHGNLAGTLLSLGEVDQALARHVVPLQRAPHDAAAYSDLLFAMHYSDKIGPEQMAMAHRRYAEQIERPRLAARQPHAQGREPDRPLRLGLVSSDLRLHSVAFFLEPLLEHLDRSAFSVVAYSNDDAADEVTQRLRSACAGWHVIAALPDDAAERLIRADGIDVLIDLNGHTRGNRLPLFARRPAPVQVTWLGYPDTTGLQGMDWRLTDAVADPPGRTEAWHSESLWRLPECFVCYRPPPDAPVPRPRPADGPVVFGSMNNHAKLSDAVVQTWARLLQQVPQSQLLIKLQGEDDASVRSAVQQRFAQQGVDPQRLQWLARARAVTEHLQRYEAIDIALDTFPYAGTTTTCDALWMGVPVVSLAGSTHASRVGASLLGSVGLDRLVASDPAHYLEIAAALANDRAALAEWRTSLRPRMAASPLTDGAAFARRFEAACRGMWARACTPT